MTTIKNTDKKLTSSLEEQVSEVRSALVRMTKLKPDTKEAWNVLCAQLGIDKDEDESDKHVVSIGFVVKRMIAVAACVAMVIAIYVLIYNKPVKGQVFTADNSKQEITLTDESNTSVARQFDFTKNKENSKDSEAQLVTMETPRGKDCQIILADGTKVWLNADSKLTFSRKMLGQKRWVKLEGEAYFEVAHHANRGFEVETKSFVVTDLGTAFNVKAYQDKESEVVVVDGKIKLTTNDDSQQQELTEGMMANVKNGKCHVQSVDPYPFMQWKDGLFYFNDATLMDVMMDIGRWYNINIVFENDKAMQTRIHFVEERNRPLNVIVGSLNEIDGVDIVIRKNELTVK